MQRVLDKYKDKGFVVLAVNIHPPEDDFVLPFLANNHYDFIPLKSPDKDWAEKVYKIRGTPTNFLIAKDGRVIFKPRIYDKDTERVLELQLDALLAHGAVNQ